MENSTESGITVAGSRFIDTDLVSRNDLNLILEDDGVLARQFGLIHLVEDTYMLQWYTPTACVLQSLCGLDLPGISCTHQGYDYQVIKRIGIRKTCCTTTVRRDIFLHTLAQSAVRLRLST